MNINDNQNYNISMRGKNFNDWINRLKQGVLNKTPEITYKNKLDTKKLNKIEHIISRPDVNRAIMGVSAIITQPAIDYYNHKVDDETREVAKNRTIAKIGVGTTVGVFLVRGPIYTLIKKCTDVVGNKKYSKMLLPKEYMEKLIKNPQTLNNYRSALSMLLSLGIMFFTNFLIDAPLTIYFTNKLNKRSEKMGKLKPRSNEKEVRNG